MEFVLTSNWLIYAAGVLLSLLFQYTPKLEAWYGVQEAKTKSLVMLGCLLAVALGIVGLSCSNLYPLVACTQGGITAVAEAFVLALIANQATYSVSKHIPLWKTQAAVEPA